jgi:hypothetical protein
MSGCVCRPVWQDPRPLHHSHWLCRAGAYKPRRRAARTEPHTVREKWPCRRQFQAFLNITANHMASFQRHRNSPMISENGTRRCTLAREPRPAGYFLVTPVVMNRDVIGMSSLLVALFVFPLRAEVCPIEGTVTTASGSPLPDVTVFLIKTGRSSQKMAQAQTSPDGAFRFTDSPCGTYTVAPNVASRTTFAAIGMKVDTRKAAALRIVVPDDSRVLPLAGISRTEPAAVAVPGGPVAAPPVPIDGTWHWDVESRIRRDAGSAVWGRAGRGEL